MSGAPRKAGPEPGEILFLSGMSGAGKSVTLRVLEDLGYAAIDNMPLDLFPAFLDRQDIGKAALAMDCRTDGFAPERLQKMMADVCAKGMACRLLFLDCDDAVLLQRFSETRRRHPLAGGRPVKAGILEERRRLLLLRSVADMVLDTSDFSANDLRQTVLRTFGEEDAARLTITVMSFGYAHGLPRAADMVFDMRFLHNPHWVEELRPHDGRDERIRAYVEGDAAFAPSFADIMALLQRLLPGYERAGRAYLTIAFGCTGGHHRSVVTAEAASQWLARHGWPNGLQHRELGMTTVIRQGHQAGAGSELGS